MSMEPDPTNLLEIAGIKTPLIGFYDVSDKKPFEPFAKPKRCSFSSYEQWYKGESVCISKNESGAAMIGDREYDMIGAKENGLSGFGVLWGFGTKDELEASGASTCVRNPGELITAFVR